MERVTVATNWLVPAVVHTVAAPWLIPFCWVEVQVGDAQTHAPLLQIVPLGQILPHEPQLLESLDKFTHDRPQRVWPGGQPPVQIPLTHFVPVGHALSHLPQFAGSAATLVHLLPVPTFPSGQQFAALVQQPPMQVRLSASYSQHTVCAGQTGPAGTLGSAAFRNGVTAGAPAGKPAPIVDVVA